MNGNLRRFHGQIKLSIILGVLVCSFGTPAILAQQTPQSAAQEATIKDPRLAPGRLLAEGKNTTPTSPLNLLTYRLEEVPLTRPAELDILGKEERFETVIRLSITGKRLQTVPIIWIDDAALTNVYGAGTSKVAVLIYDRSILRDGAVIYVSDYFGKEFYPLPERLKLPDDLKAIIKPAVEEGNRIDRIIRTQRVIGSIRQPLVQIWMSTQRIGPIRNAELYVQIGKKFFLNQVGVDRTGHIITVNLTPEEFAETKDGDEVVTFFGRPDRSGARGPDSRVLGRLNKRLLNK